MRKNRRNVIKHILAAVLFCMVMSLGMVCLADEQGTVSVKSAKIRASADPNSEQLGSVSQGKTVDIIGKTTGTDGKVWYQVYVDANTKGFIRGDLIKLKDGANVATIQGSGTSTSQETSTAPADGMKVSVINNKTNIREGASVDYASVATVNSGNVLTVIGETDGSDGKWYEVSFTYNDKEVTGFVRSDLVTTDNVPADSDVAGDGNSGEDAQDTPEEGEQADQSNRSENTVIPMNAEEEPYIMPGFEPIVLGSDGQEYKGYQNGSFFIFYAQKQNGEEGWYLFDSEKGVYQRYVYTVPGVETPKKSGGVGSGSVGLIPVIILIVIIIILIAAVGLLLLKLREQGTSSYKKYDDDEYPEDDIEDIEDLEKEEKPKPVRRPQGGMVQQPVRRPQGGTTQQPVRRPQGNLGSTSNGVSQGQPQPVRRSQGGTVQQPVRRPQGSPVGSSTQQQPVRRPQTGNPSSANGGARPQVQQPVRRPQAATGPIPQRSPQPQNERVQMQKGHKAKNLMDDDIDFMDIE